MNPSIAASATQAATPATASAVTGLARHLAALGLASLMTLTVLSTMTGLADGYRAEQQLAQAASQPMAAAQARRAPRG